VRRPPLRRADRAARPARPGPRDRGGRRDAGGRTARRVHPRAAPRSRRAGAHGIRPRVCPRPRGVRLGHLHRRAHADDTADPPPLIMHPLEQYDYAGATAIALVFLLASFVLLLLVNRLTHRYAVGPGTREA